MEWLLEFATERPAMFVRYIGYIVIAAVSLAAAIKKKKKTQKLTTDVTFDMPKEASCFSIENQDGKQEVCEEADIESCFTDFVNDEDQFIILEPPKTINGISFIQACHSDEKIELEIAIENDGKNRLFYKYFTENEALNAFIDFYNGSFAPDKDEYKPVEFIATGK